MTRTVGKFVSLLIVLFSLTAPGCVDTANDEALVRDIAFLSNGDAVAAVRDGRIMKSADGGGTWIAAADLARGGWTLGLWSLQTGAGDSLWGTVALPPCDDVLGDCAPPTIVAVSHDGGTTFVSGNLGFASLVPKLAEDPLVLKDGLLWFLPSGSPLSASLEPLGVPNPGGSGLAALACGDELFVESGWQYPFHYNIWHSSDGGMQWAHGFGTDGPVTFECSTQGTAWAVGAGAAAFVFDRATSRWSAPVDLGAHVTEQINVVYNAAVDGNGELFVLLTDSSYRPLVLGVRPEGAVRELPAFPAGRYGRLRISPDGTLWAVGDAILSFDDVSETWQQRWP